MCKNCNLIVERNPRFSNKQWEKTLYCSNKCAAAVNGKRRIGSKASNETRKKMSEALKKVVHTKEWNKKVSLANKGKIISEETRRKMSLAGLGRPSWNKGLKTGLSFWRGKKRPDISERLKGESSYAWKGDDAGYSSIHKWIHRWKGRADHCDGCGIKGKRYEWSNVDHKYRRVLDDYIPMCASCHRNYDKNNEKRTKKN